MAEFYKMEIGAWNTGTDNLSLEQEAAYLRVVNAIRLYDRPINNNLRVLAGLWRCNERKAKRLRQELVDAGKLIIDGELIINERAVEDASNLRQLRVDAQSSGSRGGIESGKTRRKSLKNNKQGEGYPSTREEKRREEYKKSEAFDEFWSCCPRKVGKGAALKSYERSLKIADAQTLLAGMRRYAVSVRGKDTQYIAHPSTWLNQQRWLDEEPGPQPVSDEMEKKRARWRKIANG